MHLHGFGEANRFQLPLFDLRTQREVLAFDPLGLPLARKVLCRFQLLRICAPVIDVEAFDPKRLQKLPQLLQHCICAPATHIR